VRAAGSEERSLSLRSEFAVVEKPGFVCGVRCENRVSLLFPLVEVSFVNKGRKHKVIINMEGGKLKEEFGKMQDVARFLT
jgi:hypothetical protein